MNELEYSYWKKRDQIIEADIIWLAQRHIASAIESLSERGYDRNSHAIRELNSIQDRLTKLAVTVQTGLEEVAEYKKEDAIHDEHMAEEGADEDRESEIHFARYGN